MASPDVVAPALLLPVPLLSLFLSLYNCLFYRSPAKPLLLVLLAVLAALAGATALSVACGGPLRLVAKVFTSLLHTILSAVSIYALAPSRWAALFPPFFLVFSLSLTTFLIACEFVSTLVQTSPLLLAATLALVSRTVLLALATATLILLHRQSDDQIRHPGKTIERVSSPTQATWPFPRSLAVQSEFDPQSQLTSPDLVPPSRHSLLPMAIMIAQLFSTLSAALNVTAGIIVAGVLSRTSQILPSVLVASAACTLLWSLTVLATIQLLPPPYLSEKHVEALYRQGTLGGASNASSRNNPVHRTSKPSLSRCESDSLLDFLSLRDPFASSPPPPPPLPPVGLGLHEVDVGWNGDKEIGIQYRFPAPRAIIKAARRKGKVHHVNGKKQTSIHTLLPVPETRGSEIDTERDKGFGDEARLAQLLLESLDEAEEAHASNSPTPVPTVTPPQVAHVQQTSRWSTGTTVQSIMSASVSNRSGVSTYTTCASEKVTTNRISMNTIASVLGSRKSSETKRKSATTVSPSKG